MEASVAAAGAADGAQQEAGGQAGADGAGAPDFAGMAATLQQLEAGQQQLRDFLTSAPWQSAESDGAAGDGADGEQIDLSFLDDPMLNSDQVGEQLQAMIGKAAEAHTAQLAEQLKGLQDSVKEDRVAREADALVAEFPDIGDEKVAQQVMQTARQLAEDLGHPELANEPRFWRMAYLNGAAIRAAKDEGGETPAAAHLESSTGARPASAAGDPADAILGVRKGSSLLPF